MCKYLKIDYTLELEKWKYKYHPWAKLKDLLRAGLQEEGSSMEFLRRGCKMPTWWGEDIDLEESSFWRS
jgi:hypothetical protein